MNSKFWFGIVSFHLFFALCACSTAFLMTPENFNAISTGAEIGKIEEIYGAPFDVKSLSNGIKEYRYIQRIDINADVSEQVEYVFTVRNGRIIDKQCRQQRSSFNFQIK